MRAATPSDAPGASARPEPAAPAYAIVGRCMLQGGDEYPCEARGLTLERAMLATRAPAEAGETVVCYLDNVGLVRGTVAACKPGGFLLALDVSDARRARIVARIDWHAARAREAVEQRTAPRIVPVHRAVEVRLGEDLAVSGTVRDLSLSGAAIALDGRARPFVGSIVRVGKRYATVVRLIEDGIAVQFKLPFIRETFNEHVVL